MATKKEQGIIMIALSVLLVAVVIALLRAFDTIKAQQSKMEELEQDKMKLLVDSIKNNNQLSNEVKEQLNQLVLEYKDIDERISNELSKAIELLNNGYTEKAVKDLVKVIEHMLTNRYEKDSVFVAWLKNKKQQFSLAKLLEFCKDENKINTIEYQFLIALKEVRNKEAHTIDLKLDKYLGYSAVVIAIGSIIKVGSFVYQDKTIDTTYKQLQLQA
jgi:hypothetical protein